MLNDVSILGRLTKDPELKTTGSGTAVVSFTLACDRDFSNKETGERSADFIDCVAWRGTAEFFVKHFSKGQMAAVLGRLQTRNYEDRDGNKRKATEVVVNNVYFAGEKKDKPVGAAAPVDVDEYDYVLPEGDEDCPF